MPRTGRLLVELEPVGVFDLPGSSVIHAPRVDGARVPDSFGGPKDAATIPMLGRGPLVSERPPLARSQRFATARATRLAVLVDRAATVFRGAVVTVVSPFAAQLLVNCQPLRVAEVDVAVRTDVGAHSGTPGSK